MLRLDEAHREYRATCVPFFTKLLFSNCISQSIYTCTYLNVVLELRDLLPDLGESLIRMGLDKLANRDAMDFYLSKGIGKLMVCGYEHGLLAYGHAEEMLERLCQSIRACASDTDIDMENVYCEVVVTFVQGVHRLQGAMQREPRWTTALLPMLCALQTETGVHKRTQIRFKEVVEVLDEQERQQRRRQQRPWRGARAGGSARAALS